eukprot:UN3645
MRRTQINCTHSIPLPRPNSFGKIDLTMMDCFSFDLANVCRGKSYACQTFRAVFRTAVYCEAILQWNASLIIGSARAHSRTLLVHCV